MSDNKQFYSDQQVTAKQLGLRQQQQHQRQQQAATASSQRSNPGAEQQPVHSDTH